MQIIDSLNQRSRRLSLLDWKMAQGAAVCVALIASKIFPSILQIDVWVLVTIAVVLYIRPLYKFYFDK